MISIFKKFLFFPIILIIVFILGNHFHYQKIYYKYLNYRRDHKKYQKIENFFAILILAGFTELDYYKLGSSLIFNLNETKLYHVYGLIISVIMVFSLDIAFSHTISSSIQKYLNDNNLLFLNHNRIRFLFEIYLNFHSIVKNNNFLICLAYFTLTPLVLFSPILKSSYYSLDSLLFALWQILFAWILGLLLSLIISDFGSYKNLMMLRNQDNKSIDKSIKQRCKLDIDKKIKDDLHETIPGYSLISYLKSIIRSRTLTENEIKYLISLSMKSFNQIFGKFTRDHISPKYFYKFQSYDHKYLVFLNRNFKHIDWYYVPNFLRNYLDNVLLSAYNNESGDNIDWFCHQFLSYRQGGLNGNRDYHQYIIPYFIRRFYYVRNDVTYWININKILKKSQLIAKLLNENISIFHYHKFSDFCNNRKQLDSIKPYFQKVVRNLLSYEIHLMNRIVRNQDIGNGTDLDELYNSIMSCFHNFVIDYFKSSDFQIDLGNDLSRILILDYFKNKKGLSVNYH